MISERQGKTPQVRILVVEGEESVAQEVAATLRRLGYEVPTTVATAEDALEKTALLQPGLVLQSIDIQGGFDGIETAELLRQRYGVPVIFLAERFDDETIESAKKVLPHGFLRKPVAEGELFAAIETALYKHEAEAGLRESESRLRESESRLLQNEARLTATLESIGDAVVASDSEGRVTFINSAAEALTGWTAEEAIGLLSSQVLCFSQGSRTTESALAHAVRGELTAASGSATLLIARDGSARPVEHTTTAIYDANGQPSGTVTACRDITQRKALEDHLLYQAFHDPLTGLANRALFHDRLHHILVKSQRNPERIAVLFIDMDNFKLVNDSLGHAAGDVMLRQVAERLETCVRSYDTVARFGGDEFAILLENAAHPHEASVVAQRLLDRLAQPYVIEGQMVYSSPSIGITVKETEEESPDEMLRRADAAMYEAKRQGRACYRIYRESLSEAARYRLELGNDLRHALEQGEITLHYQPKVHLESGKLYAVEALLRWHHPKRGSVSPAEFIPLAEQIGYIVPLGRWALREACLQARAWQRDFDAQLPTVTASGLSSPAALAPDHLLQLNVNLSVRQLHNSDLVNDVRAILAESGLDPRCLVLEITENVAIEETEHTVQVLSELKALGVQLAIDDFGIGYSSLSYLKSFPLDFLKIDRQFVAELREGNSLLVHSMVGLAHALNLQVVGEGAETIEEVNALRQSGCDLAQGYFFGKPMTAGEFGDYLSAYYSPQKS